MELRAYGTPGECKAFVEVLKGTIPPESIQRISRFYANREPDGNKGRVYINLEIEEA